MNERVIIDYDGIANVGRDRATKIMEDWLGPMMERINSLIHQEQNIKAVATIVSTWSTIGIHRTNRLHNYKHNCAHR
jgi:hypothetical protein